MKSSLNHIYRTIWSEALSAWVAVSELTSAKGKCSGSSLLINTVLAASARHSANRNRKLRLKPIVFAIAYCFALNAAQANPIGAQIANGTAIINQSGKLLTVTNSPNAIINWQGFSINTGETTRFIQQSASSSVLNRVIGPDPSQLLGALTSNGRVFLVNPAGILVGQGARIDVAGFVASTLNITNSDFLAGKLNFGLTPNAGAIQNNGTITTPEGGTVYLVAPQIGNQGIITTPKGETILAAGNTVQLMDTGTPGVTVQVTGADNNATNLGQILADSGRIGMVGAVVKNSGTVNANSLVSQGGRVFLRATNRVDAGGTVSAQGVGGGEIKVLADMQNGTVNVTGILDASAPNGGNGGFIETSAAHVHVADTARITTAAPHGKAGNWLLDPYDFTIALTGGDITGATLSTALGVGAVTIQTVSPLCTGAICGAGNPAGNGDIFVNDTVSWSSNTLTLIAERDININAVMTASGASVLALNPSTAVLDGAVKMGFNAGGSFKGRVDFGARTGTGFLTISGFGYTVLNDVNALQNMNSNLAGSYAIGSDIDATGTSTWNTGAGFVPVGTLNSTSRFTGKFDGLGHTITGLTINRPSADYVGLFGSTNAAAIRNVGLENGSVSGRDFVGGLVGRSWSSVYDRISNSYNTGTVTGSGAGGSGGVGGLVGYSSSVITNSYNTGIISGGIIVGGLVGIGGGISNSYNRGTVIGTGGEVGGLAGEGGGISNSYNSGSVSGNDSVGGLVGYQTGAITNSYSTGSVNGSTNVGGLVGYHYGGTITSSYWDKQTSGQTVSAGGAGLFTADMMKFASFTSWNTAIPNTIANTGGSGAVWRIYEGHTAPLLTSFMTPLTLTSAPDITLTYNGAAQSGGTFTLITNVLGAAAIGTNAGFYNGYYSTQQGYDITGGNLTINPLPVGLAIALAGNKVYDGTPTFSTGQLGISNVVGTDQVSLSAGTADTADKNVGANKPFVSFSGLALTGASAGNYTLTGVSGTGTITQLASVAWAGGTTGIWSNAANWANGAIPDGSNVLAVTIPSGVTVTYDSGVAGTTTLNTLTSSGSLAMAAGTLSTSGDISTAGYQQTGGTLNVGGNMTVTQSFAKASGTTGSLVLTGGSGTISIIQSTGDLVFYNNQPLRLGAVTASAGNVLIDTTVGSIVTTGNVTSSLGNVMLSAANGITQYSDITAYGNVILTANANSGTGNFIQNGGLIGNISTDGPGDIIINAYDIQVGATASKNNVMLNAAHDIMIRNVGVIGGGAAQGFHVDDQSFTYTLPFGFTYYGVPYTTMDVSSNGVITFGGGSWQYTSSTAGLISGVNALPTISPAWSDWVTYSGPSKDIYIHQPSANTLAVRWDVANYGNSSYTANFETVLSQQGNVSFNYGAATAMSPGYSAIVGVSKGDGVHYTLSVLNMPASLHNLSSTLFSYNAATGNYLETLGASVAGGGSVTAVAGVSLVAAGVTNINTLISAATINAQSSSGITLGTTGTLTASGTGDAIILNAGAGNFINNAGATALSNTGGGRWLVYSADPALDTFGGLVSGNLALWGKTYATYAQSGVMETGNRYLFSLVPALTVSAALTKTYGTDLTLTPPVATISGMINAATYGNVFTQDATTGAVGNLTSTGFAANAGVLASPYAVTVATGTLAAPAGYGATTYTNGTLTVTPFLLTVTATGVNKIYDGTLTDTVTLADNRFAWDTANLGLTYSAAFADKNTGVAKPVSITSLALTGTAAGNYILSSNSATTTASITVRPLSIWSGLGGNNLWSNPSNWDALPDGNNVLAVSIPTGRNVTYDGAVINTTLQTFTSAGNMVLNGNNLNIGSFIQTGGSFTGTGMLNVTNSFSQTGGTITLTGAAIANITQATGNLNIANLSAPTANLAASTGAITQTGSIIVAALTTLSATGTTLTDIGNQIGSFSASNSGSGNIALTNSGVLTIADIINNGGDILVDNTGATTTTGLVSASGAVSINAHSPLTIGSGGIAAGGNITLTAGATAGAGDNLTLNGLINSIGSGAFVTLFAGDNLAQNTNVTSNGGSITATALTGGISMALGTSTSGGAIGYSAPAGSIILAKLDAGKGAITLVAGGNVSVVPGSVGPSLIGGTAVINVAGNANFKTQVQILDVTVGGSFTISDTSGNVFSDVVIAPVTIVSEVVQQLVTTNKTGITTTSDQLSDLSIAANVAPLPGADITGANSIGTFKSLGGGNIGGTIGTFGGEDKAGSGGNGDAGHDTAQKGDDTSKKEDDAKKDAAKKEGAAKKDEGNGKDNKDEGKPNAKPEKC